MRVRSGDERGRIFPPLLTVEYADIRKSQMVAGTVVSSSLSISYEMENDLAHAIEVKNDKKQRAHEIIASIKSLRNFGLNSFGTRN